MRVKICGLMRREDVQAAVDSGADAVGFVVQTPSSGRNLALIKAKKLLRSVPVFATKVAVTSAGDLKTVKKIRSTLYPDVLQLHRHDTWLIRKIRSTWPETELILAAGIRNHSAIDEAARTSRLSDAVLADTLGKNGMGGTGHVHNWAMSAILRKRIYPHPLILAGGLTPSNVQLAIRTVRPYGVDVSSGVERKVGVKDHKKIHEFIVNAKGTVA
jgi:phosphoribosylanthranilate isomerase